MRASTFFCKHKVDDGAGARRWCADIGHCAEAQFCCDEAVESLVLAAAEVDVGTNISKGVVGIFFA